MDMKKEPPFDEWVEDIHRVFKRPWWQFWKRQLSKAQIQHDIHLALMGEHEPMRAYGVGLSTARERAFAEAEGLVKPGQPLTQAVKTQARLLILDHDTRPFRLR